VLTLIYILLKYNRFNNIYGGIYQMRKLNKKGVFDNLAALGIGVATLLITLVVVFLIMANVRANTAVAADVYALNATNTLTSAAATIPTWVPLIILVAIGALLLVLIRGFRS